MSHKTEVKTTLNNGHYLKKALDKLGFRYTEANASQKLKTRGGYGVHEEVDILVEGNGSQDFNGAIGFKKQADGTYVATGDFYALRTQDGQRVSAQMLKCETTASAKEAEINERLANLGFNSNSSESSENSEKIVMTMERWT